jgi:hypothetical protein
MIAIRLQGIAARAKIDVEDEEWGTDHRDSAQFDDARRGGR